MEERKIIIKVNQLELEVEIDCSELADLLWDNTPIEGVANLWG